MWFFEKGCANFVLKGVHRLKKNNVKSCFMIKINLELFMVNGIWILFFFVELWGLRYGCAKFVGVSVLA